MKKIRLITAVQIIILLYLVLTDKSMHTKSSTHALLSEETLNKGVEINKTQLKAMKTSFMHTERMFY